MEDKKRSGRPAVLCPTKKSQITKNLKEKIGSSLRKGVERLNEPQR